MFLASLQLVCSLILAASSAAPKVEWQKAPWGRAALIPFSSAPFPAASRAQGYRTQIFSFPADPYYTDNRVAVLAPYSVAPIGPVDFVVYLHGHSLDMAMRFSQGWPQGIAEHAGLPAVLLFPQGPKMVPDSDYGKLMEPGGLSRFLSEALAVLAREGVVEKASLGRVVIAAHSGGYQGTARIMSDPAQRALVGEVDLLDAAYGDYEGLVAAASAENVRFRSVFSAALAPNNVELMGRLEAQGRPFHVVREVDLTDALLASRREPLFIASQYGHDDLPDLYLVRLLRTGVLAEGK